jgi:hypothetical protein
MHTHRQKPTTPARARPTVPARAAQPAAAHETSHHARSVCADDIRRRAYEKWERAGKPPGDGVQFWLEAEQDMMRGK